MTRSALPSPSILLTLILFFLLGPTPGRQCVSGQGNSLVDPDGTVDWNRYYTAGETDQILREFHELYPELTELYAIGKSLRGRSLWVMEPRRSQHCTWTAGSIRESSPDRRWLSTRWDTS